jgi:hypothetical protein
MKMSFTRTTNTYRAVALGITVVLTTLMCASFTKSVRAFEIKRAGEVIKAADLMKLGVKYAEDPRPITSSHDCKDYIAVDAVERKLVNDGMLQPLNPSFERKGVKFSLAMGNGKWKTYWARIPHEGQPHEIIFYVPEMDLEIMTSATAILGPDKETYKKERIVELYGSVREGGTTSGGVEFFLFDATAKETLRIAFAWKLTDVGLDNAGQVVSGQMEDFQIGFVEVYLGSCPEWRHW